MKFTTARSGGIIYSSLAIGELDAPTKDFGFGTVRTELEASSARISKV